MDRIENAFFEDIIIYQESSDTEPSEKYEDNCNGKENRMKINTVQRETLLSAMDGRTDCISKGKMKTDEKTIRLLNEWNKLATELNSLGPPRHTSQEWRRIWTKMKSNKRRKISSVLGSRKENKKVKCQPNRHGNKWKSSDAQNNVISTTGQVQSEQHHIKSIDAVNVTSTVVPSQYHQESSDWDIVISAIPSVKSERRVHPEPNDMHNMNTIVVPVNNDENIAGNYIEREFSKQSSDAVNVSSTVVPSQCPPKSSDWDSVMSAIQSVGSEHQYQKSGDMHNVKSAAEPEKITDTGIKAELSRIVNLIFSLAKRQELTIETNTKKLDLLVMKQDEMNEKLNIIATAIGINIDTQKIPE